MEDDYYRSQSEDYDGEPLPLASSSIKKSSNLLQSQLQSQIRQRLASENQKSIQKVYTETEKKEQKGLRVFPIFGDHRLSMFSMNYALYMEFFHILTRILLRLLLFVVFFNAIDIIAKDDLTEGIKSSVDDIAQFCGEISNVDDRNNCARGLLFRAEMYDQGVRLIFSVIPSICAAVFFVYIRTKDEKRVINNRMLYEFNWTQDLFSVLVDKLPKGTTADELRAYFNTLPPIQKIEGSVKDVILVQDVTKCHELNKEIMRIGESLDEKQGTAEFAEDLDRIQRLKDELIAEKAKLPVHSGRAIVVFDSLRTKSLVMKLYRGSLASSWERKYRKAKDGTAPALEEAYLNVKELPEPQDLKFHNLCYPWRKKVTRMFVVYMLGLLIIVGGSLLGGGLEVFHEVEELIEHRNASIEKIFTAKIVDGKVVQIEPHHDGHHSFFSLFVPYVTPVLLLLIEAIAERLFKKSNKLTKHKSESEVEVSFLTYVIFSCFFLYLFIQGFLMIYGWEDGGSLVQRTILIFSIKYVGKKALSAYFCFRTKRQAKLNGHHADEHSAAHGHGHSHTETGSPTSPHSPLIKKHGHGHGHGHGHKKKTLKESFAGEFMKIFFHVDIENEEFEFFEEASRAFPLIAMNLAFIANGSVSLDWYTVVPHSIPLTIVALYIGAFCDKYRLMNQHEHCKLNSARFMLKMFKFLKADHFAAVFGTALWAGSFFAFIKAYQAKALALQFTEENKHLGVDLTSNINRFNFVTQGLIGFILCTYFFYVVILPNSPSMEERFVKKFLSNKSLVSYDSVAPYFPAVYEAPVYIDEEEHNKHKALIL